MSYRCALFPALAEGTAELRKTCEPLAKMNVRDQRQAKQVEGESYEATLVCDGR